MSHQILTNLNINAVPTYDLSFTIDMGTTTWYRNAEKQDADFLSTSLKTELPKNSLFLINSLVFNLEKHEREVYSKYYCFYDETENSLSIVVSDKAKYSHFSREIMMNLMDFVQKTKINTIYFLLNRKNGQYVKILQGMLTVGFEYEEKLKKVEIDGGVYKVLKMNMKDVPDEIEEVDF